MVPFTAENLLQVKLGEYAGTAPSKDAWRALMHNWLRIFGPPEVIVTDQGLEYAKDFESGCDRYGIIQHVIDLDSPHQKGAGAPDFNQLLLQVLTRSSSALAAAETAAEATADDGTTKVSHDAGDRDAQLSGHGECDKSDAKRSDTALPPQPQPQPQQQQVARSRKKASASAGGQLFRCCSAPQRVEN